MAAGIRIAAVIALTAALSSGEAPADAPAPLPDTVSQLLERATQDLQRERGRYDAAAPSACATSDPGYRSRMHTEQQR
ncbi:MAG: hypothetical protein J0M02_12205 [Planctomycetes bacterium]|nr:hypothetical protein [Planctomycetota bacterium]